MHNSQRLSTRPTRASRFLSFNPLLIATAFIVWTALAHQAIAVDPTKGLLDGLKAALQKTGVSRSEKSRDVLSKLALITQYVKESSPLDPAKVKTAKQLLKGVTEAIGDTHQGIFVTNRPEENLAIAQTLFKLGRAEILADDKTSLADIQVLIGKTNTIYEKELKNPVVGVPSEFAKAHYMNAFLGRIANQSTFEGAAANEFEALMKTYGPAGLGGSHYRSKYEFYKDAIAQGKRAFFLTGSRASRFLAHLNMNTQGLTPGEHADLLERYRTQAASVLAQVRQTAVAKYEQTATQRVLRERELAETLPMRASDAEIKAKVESDTLAKQLIERETRKRELLDQASAGIERFENHIDRVAKQSIAMAKNAPDFEEPKTVDEVIAKVDADREKSKSTTEPKEAEEKTDGETTTGKDKRFSFAKALYQGFDPKSVDGFAIAIERAVAKLQKARPNSAELKDSEYKDIFEFIAKNIDSHQGLAESAVKRSYRASLPKPEDGSKPVLTKEQKAERRELIKNAESAQITRIMDAVARLEHLDLGTHLNPESWESRWDNLNSHLLKEGQKIVTASDENTYRAGAASFLNLSLLRSQTPGPEGSVRERALSLVARRNLIDGLGPDELGKSHYRSFGDFYLDILGRKGDQLLRLPAAALSLYQHIAENSSKIDEHDRIKVYERYQDLLTKAITSRKAMLARLSPEAKAKAEAEIKRLERLNRGAEVNLKIAKGEAASDEKGLKARNRDRSRIDGNPTRQAFRDTAPKKKSEATKSDSGKPTTETASRPSIQEAIDRVTTAIREASKGSIPSADDIDKVRAAAVEARAALDSQNASPRDRIALGDKINEFVNYQRPAIQGAVRAAEAKQNLNASLSDQEQKILAEGEGGIGAIAHIGSELYKDSARTTKDRQEFTEAVLKRGDMNSDLNAENLPDYLKKFGDLNREGKRLFPGKFLSMGEKQRNFASEALGNPLLYDRPGASFEEQAATTRAAVDYANRMAKSMNPNARAEMYARMQAGLAEASRRISERIPESDPRPGATELRDTTAKLAKEAWGRHEDAKQNAAAYRAHPAQRVLAALGFGGRKPQNCQMGALNSNEAPGSPEPVGANAE